MKVVGLLNNTHGLGAVLELVGGFVDNVDLVTAGDDDLDRLVSALDVADVHTKRIQE